MSDLTFVVFRELSKLNGTRFYRYQDGELILGPPLTVPRSQLAWRSDFYTVGRFRHLIFVS